MRDELRGAGASVGYRSDMSTSSGDTRVNQDAIASTVVCSWAWVVRRLAINSYKGIQCDEKLDEREPEAIKSKLDGITVESTDMSNLVVIYYSIAEKMIRQYYGSEGVRLYYSLAMRNTRPLLSHFTRLYATGLKIIENKLGGSLKMPLFVINKETCIEAENVIKNYCIELLEPFEKRRAVEKAVVAAPSL